MKSLFKLICMLLVSACTVNGLYAQNTKADKKAAKAAETKKLINSMNYVFVANFVYPQNGAGRSLTGPYDLRLTKDKIVAYLPYFGRVYSAPMDASEGGIKLTSTHFEYKATQNKKGSWDITFKPQEQNPSGPRDVLLFRLTVAYNGSASLMVTSMNRDPINFDGEIEPVKDEKQ